MGFVDHLGQSFLPPKNNCLQNLGTFFSVASTSNEGSYPMKIEKLIIVRVVQLNLTRVQIHRYMYLPTSRFAQKSRPAQHRHTPSILFCFAVVVQLISFSCFDRNQFCITIDSKWSDTSNKAWIANTWIWLYLSVRAFATTYLQTPLLLPEFFLIGQWGLLYSSH